MEEKVVFENNLRMKLSGILHIPKEKKEIGIIIMHGFASGKDKNFIPSLSEKLEKNKYVSLRFDCSGYGESQGKFEEQTMESFVEDLKSAIEFLKKRGFEKICVIGHSLGGSAITIEYVKYKNFDYAVLLAPAGKKTKGFAENQLKELNEKGSLCIELKTGKYTIKKKYIESRQKNCMINVVKDFNIPSLFVFGEKEAVVDIDEIKEFYRLIDSEKGWVTIEGVGHNYRNEAKNIIEPILSFLKKQEKKN